MPRRYDDEDDYDDRPRRRRRDEDDDEYDDRPRRRRPKKASGVSPLLLVGLLVGGLVVFCGGGIGLVVWAVKQADKESEGELTAARAGFKSKLTGGGGGGRPVPRPPAGVFELVKYNAPNGPTSAYITPDPKDGKRHPAVVWITGGDCNSIDDGVFAEGPASNDQSAAAFRKAGVVMMFPSLRGGNDSPGRKEGFLGETDDVVAAAEHLGRQPYVDPARIYLGGHSTGGTLVLLAAAVTDKFRAVFSFGPVDEVDGYPAEFCPFNRWDDREVEVRSPGRWLHAVKVPTFVIEGEDDGNEEPLQAMRRRNTNPKLSFHLVRRADHFSVLAPANRLLAAKVLADTGTTCGITLTETELNRAAGGR